MLLEVQQHVGDTATGLRRAAQRVRMVAALPDPSGSSGRSIDGLGRAGSQPSQSAIERRGIVRLDDEMNVIALNRKMNDAKPEEHRRRDRSTERREDAHGAQRGDRRRRPHRDVNGVTRLVRRPWVMRWAASSSLAFASRAGSRAAPSRWRGQVQLLGGAAAHRGELSDARSARCARGARRNIAQSRVEPPRPHDDLA